ncbi:F-box/WD repeat-containing protein 7 [Galendromus occidentalis]|uniref:F-box/WD repeat-containing protein 7 n=1 Tax=Galendromus occidentalis TaxID=34638 RepID=A0AAJ6VWV8_9ACAR|nr:F-box/WD repeat-containing protein 7 [Galendromus occidentalis]
MDINSAQAEELASLATVGPILAVAIVKAREESRGLLFRRLEDLIRVHGITEDFVEVNRAHLVCRPSPTPADADGALETHLRNSNLERDEVNSLASSVDRLLSDKGGPPEEDLDTPAHASDEHGLSPVLDQSMQQDDESSGSSCDARMGSNSAGPPPKRKSDVQNQQQCSPASKKICRGPELESWLQQFISWSHGERSNALDCLMSTCDASQVRHVMSVIEPRFQRDFISLLPKELALYVLAFLEPRDLLRAAQTCRYWRVLAEDNLLWRIKCREHGIETPPQIGGSSPRSWKRAFMRQYAITMNWRSRPLRKLKALKGHDDHVITCLQFSGNRIVSGSDDYTLKVWSAASGKCLRVLVGHSGGVWSSQMSGAIVISGSTDRTLKVWNADSGECIHTLFGHTSTVRCMHLHGNRVVSGSRDATLRLWDISTGECMGVFIGHVAAVRCVQYNGKLIVSGAYDYMVKVWHPEREECLHTLHGHTNRVYSLQFDGVHVVSGSLDASIRVWDVETGQCKHELVGHQSLTSGMELRDNILVSGNADSTVKVWDIISGKCLQTLAGASKHQSAVTCLQFNSKFVITSSDDGTVKLWDLKTGEFLRNLVSLPSAANGGVVWRIRADQTKLVAAVGSRNGTEETKLLVLDFDDTDETKNSVCASGDVDRTPLGAYC